MTRRAPGKRSVIVLLIALNSPIMSDQHIWVYVSTCYNRTVQTTKHEITYREAACQCLRAQVSGCMA